MTIPGNNIRCFISCTKEDLDKAQTIGEFLKEEGIETVTWEDFALAGMSIRESLQNAIEKVDLVIFLVSNNAIRSENLYYEMGIVVGMGKPLFALVEKNAEQRIPSDLSSIMYLNYDPQNLRASLSYVRNWAVHSVQSLI